MTLTDDILPIVAPARGIPGPPAGAWTWADLDRTPDDGRRYEILNGVLYESPPPATGRERCGSAFVHYLFGHVELGGLGLVFGSHVGVELRPGDVVQPDVAVVLMEHADRVLPGKIVGAPDLVVEILSPSTAGYDRREKQDAYALAGVPEYWIADRAERTVEVLVLDGAAYRPLGAFRGKATLPSRVLPGFAVPVDRLFPAG